ncbi:hypothetical protein F7D74_08710 [Prevotella copri]|uniref:Uncharacterized protein n=1 Tax=Segatella copri TaxID=165179 RepID=A0AA90UXM3_9BACT|nr:hypothetical protein [Segatella copri]
MGNGNHQSGLKAQRLLAQGSALGIIAASKAPCKGCVQIYFFKTFSPKSLPVSKRNRNFVVWYIAT